MKVRSGNHQKIQTTEFGGDTGLRCLCMTRKEVFWLIAFGVVGGIVLASVAQRWYGEGWLQAGMVFFVHGWLLVAAWSDVKSRKVSNRWSLLGAGAGVAFLVLQLLFLRQGWTFVSDRLFGAILASGILFAGALFRRRGIGMGDVKVFFVLGVFLGTETVGLTLLVTLVAALIIAAVGIISGKIGRKHRLPLCPFAYVAMVMAVLAGG